MHCQVEQLTTTVDAIYERLLADTVWQTHSEIPQNRLGLGDDASHRFLPPSSFALFMLLEVLTDLAPHALLEAFEFQVQ
jgi:hypothetical protein